MTISNVTCENSGSYGLYIVGLPDANHSDIRLTNVTLKNGKGAYLRNCQGIVLERVSFVNSGQAPYNVAQATNLKAINCSPQPEWK